MKMFAADGGVQPQLQPHLDGTVRIQPHAQPHLVDLNGPLTEDQTLAKTATREDSQGRLVTCRLDELHPHPSYVRHHFAVSITKLSALAEQGELAFREPLTITRDRTILDGYARVELARHKGRSALPCIEYDLNQEEALCWLLRTHRRSEGLNSFCRILLALDLEHGLQEKARSNQRIGGLNKGSSNLTQANRLDVRSEIAAAAGVSVGNVTKVKHLKTAACQELQDALRCREVSIHRAWLWSKLSLEEQRKALWRSRTEGKMRKTIRTLIAGQRSKSAPIKLDLNAFAERLGALESHELAAVRLEKVRICGKTIIVSEELAQTLGLEQLCLCDTKTP